MSSPPSGTLTLLVTEIEDSTQLWERHVSAMQAAHRRQLSILKGATEKNNGYAFDTSGDSYQAAFPTAEEAIKAAVDAQRLLHAEVWGEVGVLRVRMALHSGVVEESGDGYAGPLLNKAERLVSVGHGGQVLLSEVTCELARDTLPEGVSLRDLGEHRLKELAQPERIYQIVAAGIQSDFPHLRTVGEYPNNLPIQATSFIGREKQVARVREKLIRPDVRLLTLTGPGGIGKTRLALQTVVEMLAEYPDGSFFVNLATVLDPDLVIPTIAHTLGLQEAGGEPIADILKEYLRDKRLLLVLDNFEQVIQAAPQIAGILNAAGLLKALVTSRAPLRVSAEHEYQVQPLEVPNPKKVPPDTTESLSQYEAVALFIRRAATVKQGFTVDNDNAPAVAEICYRLEGIPLAIELAAARIKMLTPQALLARLGSRLQILTGGARDLDARQQTLRNTIAWSYDLLTQDEKRLFRRMAVFRGGATLEGAEEVCNAGGAPSVEALGIDILDGITSLADKSLLYSVEGAGEGHRHQPGRSGELRYLMLETIREFAREKLQESGEAEVLEKEHAQYFMGYAEQAETRLIGPEQAAWLERLEDEHDNIRAALHWASRGAASRESGSAEAGVAGVSQGGGAIDVGLRTAGALWRFWEVRGYHTEGRAQLTSLLALDAANATKEARAKAFNAAANLSHSQGDYAISRSFHEQSLALRREIGDTRGIAASLNNLGLVSYRQGDYAAARSFHEQSLAIKKERGDKWGMSSSFMNLGLLAQEVGDFASARSLYEQSLALKEELGDKEGIATLHSNLGSLAAEQGDYGVARSSFEQSLAMQRELGDKQGIAISLNELGVIDSLDGKFSTGVPLIEESLALSREMGDRRSIAYSLSSLGMAAYMQGEYATAHSYYRESLVLRREIGSKVYLAYSLALIGGLRVSRGEAEEGSRMLGATEALLESIGAVLDAEHRKIYERSVASARAQLGDEGFERAWEEGRAMSMEQAVEYELGDI
jgi:predicted ATPase/class 3 adenylate cyclase/lipoprotein NlpI